MHAFMDVHSHRRCATIPTGPKLIRKSTLLWPVTRKTTKQLFKKRSKSHRKLVKIVVDGRNMTHARLVQFKNTVTHAHIYRVFQKSWAHFKSSYLLNYERY